VTLEQTEDTAEHALGKHCLIVEAASSKYELRLIVAGEVLPLGVAGIGVTSTTDSTAEEESVPLSVAGMGETMMIESPVPVETPLVVVDAGIGVTNTTDSCAEEVVPLDVPGTGVTYTEGADDDGIGVLTTVVTPVDVPVIEPLTDTTRPLTPPTEPLLAATKYKTPDSSGLVSSHPVRISSHVPDPAPD
jgi:hypothetical protein